MTLVFLFQWSTCVVSVFERNEKDGRCKEIQMGNVLLSQILEVIDLSRWESQCALTSIYVLNTWLKSLRLKSYKC